MDFSAIAGTSTTFALKFKDATGSDVAAPSGGGIATSDPSVATAVLADDDTNTTVSWLVAGSVTLTYTNGALSAVLNGTVSSAAASVEFVAP